MAVSGVIDVQDKKTMSANFELNRIVDWLQPRLTKAFSNTVAKWMSRLLILFLAWTLGQQVWLFSGAPSVSVLGASMGKSGKADVNSQAPIYELDQLISLNLFGLYNATIPIVDSLVDAPRTNLNLTLVGLVANSSPSRGLAVIANSGSQSIYGVGETITGTGVVLRQVMADRVILRNSGRDEALMLEGLDYTKRAQPLAEAKQTKAKSSSQDESQSSVDLSSVKAEILENPQTLLKFITLSQERGDEGIVGYRLGPGQDARLFNESGLQAGDVAVSINGVDLTDPSQMNKIWQNLTDASEIILTVRRDDQLHKIYISL